ncbi:hypothetical protein GCM10010363_32340 [Streptomyces omiyaensis]|nr:hypothetical protein GCM10010363_32340 [Streptomyces omiyaensis]
MRRLGVRERVEVAGGGEGGERLVPHALDLFRFQGFDLDRVVRLIGCRHLFPCFRWAGWGDPGSTTDDKGANVPKVESNGAGTR